MHDFRCSREDFMESWTVRSCRWRNNIFDPLSLPILEKPASHITFITIGFFWFFWGGFILFYFFFTHTHCILFLQEINRLTPSIVNG